MTSLLSHLIPDDIKAIQKSLYRSFYITLGGLKPVIYVFDDYNNYVTFDIEKNIYIVRDFKTDDKKIGKYYCLKKIKCDDRDSDLEEILKGFCLNLNSLSLVFDVKAPPLWIPSNNTEPSYELIASTITFDQVERDRPHIAAFIVDFEWKPTLTDFIPKEEEEEKWKIMGYRAIHILSQKYPEIPSFLFTGIKELKYLEKGLSYGASWCFYKNQTHHRDDNDSSTQQNANEVEKQIEPLHYLSLEHHLEETAKTLYSAYQDNPFTNQFKIDISTPLGKKFFKQLGLTPPLDKSPKGDSLLTLIATLFPSGDEVELVKLLTSGKSAAQATFFLKPKNQATRFMKIGSWLSIQREYFAYQQVIQPRLNSYAAAIIRKPVVSPSNSEQIPTGALMYSLAGFPEDYQRLRPLDDLMKQQLNQPTGGDFLVSRIQNTLEKVLKPLSHSGIAQSQLSTEKLPLWQWLGNTLPPLSGVLIPLEFVSADDLEIPSDSANLSGEGKERKVKPLQSYIAQGYKEKSAWTLASFELERQKKTDKEDIKTGKEDISSWGDRQKFQNAEKILLCGWQLLEVSAQEGEFGEGSVMLAHPDLGVRIKLRGRGRDICQRFGATWIRPGMPVEVLVCLDDRSQEVKKMQDKIFSVALAEKVILTKDALSTKGEEINQLLEKLPGIKDKLPNPFDYFGDRSKIPYHYTLSAHIGTIHGDFNLQNILFGSEQEQVGWLIDFERSQDRGMVAYDFAKLEVEIWNHHLTPSLVNLANLLPQGSQDKLHYHLLDLALRAVEFEGNGAEFFVAQLIKPDLAASQALILPIGNALKAIATIRRFALKTCKLDMVELRWALSAYCLNSSKFPDIDPWASIFAFLASAWHLEKVMPKVPDQSKTEEAYKDVFDKIILGARGTNLRPEVDGILIQLQNHPDKIIQHQEEKK